MDYEERSIKQYSKNLSRLKYKSAPCTTFEIDLYVDGAAQFVQGTKEGPELLSWARSFGSTWRSRGLPARRIRLIVAPRIHKHSLLYMPFEKEVFDEILTNFQLPKSLLQAMLDGKLHYSEIEPLTKSERKGVVLRTAPDYFDRQDLALAMSFALDDSSNREIIYGLLFGCGDDSNEPEVVQTFLEYSRYSAGDPALLLALASALQLERFKSQDHDVDTRITLALHEARMNRIEEPGVRVSPNYHEEDDQQIDYNDLTKRVMQVFDEAGYLAQTMKQFCKMMDRNVLKFVSAPWKEGYDHPALHSTANKPTNQVAQEPRTRIRGYIETTKDEILILAENNRFVSERASLLMSSLWNLIAQEESQRSRNIAAQSQALAEQSKALAVSSKEIAEDAKRIAAATRRDSASMKAIAALTMVFLPFTFVATLFAMPILNWQAGPNEHVLSDRSLRYFRIYWVAATPLTVLVLLSWALWTWWSIRKQTAEDAELERKRMEVKTLESSLSPTAQGTTANASTVKVIHTSA